MPNLGDVLGAILRDQTVAQHVANQTTARLADQYRDHKTLRGFPVPNPTLQEVEIELKFAIADPGLLPLSQPPAAAEPRLSKGGKGEPAAKGVDPRVDVIVQADQLAGLPESSIQTLRLRLGFSGFRWVSSGAGQTELIET
ncbi:MAG TPA: hypothetical protein VLE27_16980 [Thermoanaerobaculia bacterium]|nr:hypothetical protein [Thermoanaerobaculia bacterium]